MTPKQVTPKKVTPKKGRPFGRTSKYFCSSRIRSTQSVKASRALKCWLRASGSVIGVADEDESAVATVAIFLGPLFLGPLFLGPFFLGLASSTGVLLLVRAPSVAGWGQASFAAYPWHLLSFASHDSLSLCLYVSFCHSHLACG